MSGLLDIFDFEYQLAPSDGILEQQTCNIFLTDDEEDDEEDDEFSDLQSLQNLDNLPNHRPSKLSHSQSHASALSSQCKKSTSGKKGTSVTSLTDNSSDRSVSGRSRRPHTQSLPPEVEEGNVEYKLKLINPTPNRLQQLITQMKWRLKEGKF